ncbi:FHA domain-containing protein [Streptomyces sp. TLI_171]|uniref:FHA domain-containing protein n=1 Tax=Streptomyces sp. TLI_171 TaxID=1938859 RepID=UPI00217CEC75|nr:FHA domain-containing protein [Streptomyces sp. TLI_171]
MTPPPGLAIPGHPAGQPQAGGPGAPAAAPYPGQYPPAGPGSTPPSGTPNGGGYFEPRRTPTPPSGTPAGPGGPGAPGPYGAPPPGPTGGLVTCPICRSPQTGRYCEECGYDYNLATSARPPGAAPGGQPGYGFPPPSPQPPAPPAAPAAPSAYERPQAAQPPQAPKSPYEPPAPAPSPFERPGFPPAAPGPAAPPAVPGYPSAPSFDKGPSASFPDVDYERTGPVYAEPSAPPQQHQQPRHQQPGSEEFGTSFRLNPPGQQGQQGQSGPQGRPGQPGQPPAAPQRTTWFAVVTADHDYFNDMMARSGPDAAGLYFPPYTAERRIPLTGRGQLRIGRRSQQRGTVPEIDLSVAPEDPGASHQHALLAEQPDGSWVVVDQDSTNGTTLNGSPDTLPPHTAVPLNDGDRIHVGAWTTITVHRA